jgi:Zn-dependent protease
VEEIVELAIASLVIALILTLPNFKFFIDFLFATILGFVAHELAHKFVARRFGALARFKISYPGLLWGLILSTFFMTLGVPIKIAAPGAVLISQYRFKLEKPRITFEEIGIISLAGPLTNLLLALLFWQIPTQTAQIIFRTNCSLAIFNLLPIQPLDGSKIFWWKRWLWFLIFLIPILLLWI